MKKTDRAAHVAAVQSYYNDWQDRYADVYGDVIQAFRPTDETVLLQYIGESAGLQKGEQVLDAGCGTCGPARYFVSHFACTVSGVTISEKQVELGRQRNIEMNLNGKIRVLHGDYHRLADIFPAGGFDRVLFLESLGHAADAERVISETSRVLKSGGYIYIKDFYFKTPTAIVAKERIRKVVNNINRLYTYNVLDLNETLHALRSTGFEIDFIRRFGFKDDIRVRQAFEAKFDIDIFAGEPEFTPAEWLEIKCVKP